MNDPWFDPNRWAWLPGTLLGVLGGLWGGLAGTLAPQGKARRLVLGSGELLQWLSVILLGAGLIALFTGQPYGIWYGLGLAGLIGTVVLGPALPQIRKRYREAEERRMQAEDSL
jgi:hypothetical protein